ncbi:MAG: cell division protein ZapA [Burkholderiaceae bacterium]|nr:cell division protein ZapA [Burkholderiaceae bacterium]
MEQIDVRILDREYRLAVSGESKPQLLEAVQMVDEKMRSIREAGRISGVDRIAVMAALQLAHELLGAQHPVDGTPKAQLLQRIRKMTDDIDAEMKRQESLF